MHRLAAALIAATFALSPLAIFGVTSGMQAAHADLGWCDECDAARPVRVPVPLSAPTLAPPVWFGFQP